MEIQIRNNVHLRWGNNEHYQTHVLCFYTQLKYNIFEIIEVLLLRDFIPR